MFVWSSWQPQELGTLDMLFSFVGAEELNEPLHKIYNTLFTSRRTIHEVVLLGCLPEFIYLFIYSVIGFDYHIRTSNQEREEESHEYY